MRIFIDGKEIAPREGETVLDVCRRAGNQVPSMCFVPRAEHKPSCMVCMVKDEDSGQMIPSCSTFPSDGMRIDTVSDEVISTRKLAVELLLSDHRADCEAPCTMVCPSGLDVGEMLYRYDKGDLAAASGLIFCAFPDPKSACEGCKAPCEKACRRGTVDAHVAIREIIKEVVESASTATAELLPPPQRTSNSAFNSRLGVFSPQEKIDLKSTVTTKSACLHCACLSRDDCRLREIGTELKIKAPRFGVDSLQPFKAAKRLTGRLIFEPAKCICCGLCVYNTEDGFTFKRRGFAMQVIIPEKSHSHVSEDIASLCPTGALSLEH